MDQDLWSRLAVSYEGVDILLAPESVAARYTVEPPVAAALAAFWRQRYDTIVIDTPGARAAAESGFAAIADDLLLVATNELSPLHATRRAIEYLEQSVPDRARLRLLLNRYTPATGLKRADVKIALALEPFATLPNDYDALQSAILEGRPVPSTTRFAAGVDGLSRLLRGQPPAARKGGWLSRLAFAK
jgi:Flp pilus assembly CpaE family ATPase